jgi:hypothetical protein
MTTDERRTVQMETARAIAEKVAGMAKVGGSPALTEALDAVAKFVRRLADDVANGSDVLGGDE